MAIIAVIMSVNFMACSDDDDEEDNRPDSKNCGAMGINL